MATGDQLKSLIRSHYEDDRERFTTIALQLAAHEAKQGHDNLAHEIRKLIDKAKTPSVKIIRFNSELNDLIVTASPKQGLAELIVTNELKERIQRIVTEFRQQDKLKKHGMTNRRKILLAGPPGTGKTMTAAILAKELRLPFHTILMDRLITKFMGETSAKLRQIFDVIREQRAVYLFDEFDAIGVERGRENDVGEMRRVLNAFLQFIELDDSTSLIVAATNNPHSLDQALFRRFDDILYYGLPSRKDVEQLIKNRLHSFWNANTCLDKVIETDTVGLSHAEITLACDDAIKEAILADETLVGEALLQKTLQQRRRVYGDNLNN